MITLIIAFSLLTVQADTCIIIEKNNFVLDSSFHTWDIFVEEYIQTAKGYTIDIMSFIYNDVNVVFKQSIKKAFDQNELNFIYSISNADIFLFIYEVQSSRLFYIELHYDMLSREFRNDSLSICPIEEFSEELLSVIFKHLSKNDLHILDSYSLARCNHCSDDFLIIDFDKHDRADANRYFVSMKSLVNSKISNSAFIDVSEFEKGIIDKFLRWLIDFKK